jgi:hypothetical protein
MIARDFQIELEKDGYLCQLNGDKLFFPPLKMELGFEQLYTQGYVTCIKVSISHPSLLPEGLQELAIGFGEEEAARLASSATGWMQSDFPVIHSYLCPSGTDLGVKRMELVSQTGDKQLGWNVLLGPLAIMGDQMNLSEDSIHELFIYLFNEITGLLRLPKILYLKLFVSKATDGSINADCRLLGENWIEGTNKLCHFAEQLDTQGKFHSRKQFIIIYPRPLDELKKGEDLAIDVNKKYQETYGPGNNQEKKKWYEFWK